MPMNVIPESLDPWTMSRREAIKRSVLLLGAAISPSILAGVMQAQPTSSRTQARAAYLTAKQLATAEAVAERILPRTDTPGATDVGVPAFIDLMYGKYMTDDEKSILAAGLAEVESTSQAAHRRPFPQLDAAQQDTQLKAMAVAAQPKEKSFFHLIKE